jgi:excisionase family DNA binding protein
MAITTEHEWLTIAETAELLRVDRSTIRRWIKSGRLPAELFGERAIRIPRRAVMTQPATPDESGDLLTKAETAAILNVPATMDVETRNRLRQALERSRQRRATEEAAGIVPDPSIPPAWVLINEARDERYGESPNDLPGRLDRRQMGP